MTSTGVGHAHERVEQKPNSEGRSLIITIALAVVVWVFSAGMLYQKVQDLDSDMRDVKAALGLRMHAQK